MCYLKKRILLSWDPSTDYRPLAAYSIFFSLAAKTVLNFGTSLRITAQASHYKSED